MNLKTFVILFLLGISCSCASNRDTVVKDVSDLSESQEFMGVNPR